MTSKIVIINRAVPGSGKTTITNCIVEELKNIDINTAVHSTDEYFMVKEKYIFNIDKLGKYHDQNLNEFRESIEKKFEVVICDNTNIAPWQTEPYTNLARENGYQIVILTLDPRELEKHVASQQVTSKKPDAHGVAEDILKKMIREYYIFDDLLNPNIVINPGKHIHYIWDNDKKETVNIGIAKHFDSDFIIRIMPSEYKEYQKSIGGKVLELIKNKVERV
jgi:broad-specificity NMP kinase